MRYTRTSTQRIVIGKERLRNCERVRFAGLKNKNPAIWRPTTRFNGQTIPRSNFVRRLRHFRSLRSSIEIGNFTFCLLWLSKSEIGGPRSLAIVQKQISISIIFANPSECTLGILCIRLKKGFIIPLENRERGRGRNVEAHSEIFSGAFLADQKQKFWKRRRRRIEDWESRGHFVRMGKIEEGNEWGWTSGESWKLPLWWQNCKTVELCLGATITGKNASFSWSSESIRPRSNFESCSLFRFTGRLLAKVAKTSKERRRREEKRECKNISFVIIVPLFFENSAPAHEALFLFIELNYWSRDAKKENGFERESSHYVEEPKEGLEPFSGIKVPFYHDTHVPQTKTK